MTTIVSQSVVSVVAKELNHHPLRQQHQIAALTLETMEVAAVATAFRLKVFLPRQSPHWPSTSEYSQMCAGMHNQTGGTTTGT